ncbi:MAG: hypothetical protein LAP85_11065 [Acidobacteriia bacterium]|nr:hypothetical protein [Terriglobia bacterium]
MPGIYYYIWNQYTLDDADEINRDLEDIRELGFDFILVDLHESFLREGDERHRRYRIGVRRLLRESGRLGLRVLPICNFGAGLFTKKWWNQNLQSAMRTQDGSVFINPDHGIPVTNYDESSAEKLVAHQRYIVGLVGDVLYEHSGVGVVEVLEDAGFHYTEQNLTFPGDSITERKTRLTLCLRAMRQEATDRGYKTLVKTFRCAQPFHADRDRMGIDYDAIVREADGIVDGIVHHPDAPGTTWNEQIRNGFELVSSCELLFPVVLCERSHFSPGEQVEAILEHTNPADVIFYQYNERISSDVGLREHEPHRQVVREWVRELAARNAQVAALEVRTRMAEA